MVCCFVFILCLSVRLSLFANVCTIGLDCAVFYAPPPTQYRLYGRRFLQVKRPNQQYQSTEVSYKGKQKQHKEHNTHRNTK